MYRGVVRCPRLERVDRRRSCVAGAGTTLGELSMIALGVGIVDATGGIRAAGVNVTGRFWTGDGMDTVVGTLGIGTVVGTMGTGNADPGSGSDATDNVGTEVFGFELRGISSTNCLCTIECARFNLPFVQS